MIQLASEKLVNYLSKKDVIQKGEEEVYLYGYEIMFSNLLGFLIVILLGFLIDGVLYSLLFYAVFVSLRQYTGGFHANTYLICNSIFTVVVLAVLLSSMLISPYWKWYYSLAVITIQFFMVCKFAPLDNENKRLTPEEKEKHKKVSLVLSGVWSIVAIATAFTFVKASVVVNVTMFFVSLLLYIGVKFENRRIKQ